MPIIINELNLDIAPPPRPEGPAPEPAPPAALHPSDLRDIAAFLRERELRLTDR